MVAASASVICFAQSASAAVPFLRAFPVNGPSFTLDGSGNLYAASNGGAVNRYDLNGNLEGGFTVASNFNSPNDLAIDSRGRIWFSDPRYRAEMAPMELDHHSILRATPAADGSWSLERVTFDTTRPNGLLVSADDRWLYVADNNNNNLGGARKLWRFRLRPDGSPAPDVPAAGEQQRQRL